MIITAKHVQGQGRGKELGFPTLNLETSEAIDLEDGIYVAWVVLDGKPYKSALHYGPVPTFGQTNRTLEAHLLDLTDENFPIIQNELIEVDIVERLRDVKRFLDSADLIDQIARDVERTRNILG